MPDGEDGTEGECSSMRGRSSDTSSILGSSYASDASRRGGTSQDRPSDGMWPLELGATFAFLATSGSKITARYVRKPF